MKLMHQCWLINHIDLIGDLQTLLKQWLLKTCHFMKPPTVSDLEKGMYMTHQHLQLPNQVVLYTTYGTPNINHLKKLIRTAVFFYGTIRFDYLWQTELASSGSCSFTLDANQYIDVYLPRYLHKDSYDQWWCYKNEAVMIQLS